MNSKISCVHIGFHKTASTWMQLYGFHLHPKLKLLNSIDSDFEKFWVKEFLEIDDFNFDKYLLLNRIEEELQSIKDNNFDVYMISEENISGQIYTGCNAKRNADNLFELFGNVKIFILIRKQADYLLSTYSNYINHGGSLSLEGWLKDKNFLTNPIYFKLKYDSLISYYYNLFGKENVLVLPYELFVQRGAAYIMNNLFEFVGLHPIPESSFQRMSTQKINSSFSTKGIRISRLVNGIRGNISNTQRRILRVSDKYIFKYLPFDLSLISAKKLMEFSEEFKISNQKTSEMIGFNLKDLNYPM